MDKKTVNIYTNIYILPQGITYTLMLHTHKYSSSEYLIKYLNFLN